MDGVYKFFGKLQTKGYVINKFKDKKQFRHKAEIPLTVVSVILNVAILSLLTFLLIQIPENPDIKKFITDFFGLNKDTVDALIHLGIYAVDILCIVLVIHIFLTYFKSLGQCKGYDIKPDDVQMKDIKKFLDDYTNQLNLKQRPEVYFHHGDKSEIKALGVKFKIQTVIRLSANYVKAYYGVEKYKPALNFVIAKELGHIYLGHANGFWIIFTFIARMLPIYGDLFSRVLNYSADKVAAELVGDMASDALVMSVLNPKTVKVLEVDDLYRYKRENFDKSVTSSIHFSVLFSEEAPPAYRLEAIERNISGRVF